MEAGGENGAKGRGEISRGLGVEEGLLSSVSKCGGWGEGHTGLDLITRIVWDHSGSELLPCHLPSYHNSHHRE